MNEKMKCFNIHGHTYLYELTFKFNNIDSIGYAIDFKEIKRVACQWIDDVLDHGVILNPKDSKFIKCAMVLESKLWLMSLNGAAQYCNPTVENIGKELFLAVQLLMRAHLPNLWLDTVRIYETPNCFCDTTNGSINASERNNFLLMRGHDIKEYALSKGIIKYDDREIED